MKRRITIAIFVFLPLIIVCLVSQLVHQKEWWAMGRFKLEGDSNSVYKPYFFQKEMETISNMLCSSDSSNELARSSQVKSVNFKLTEIRPVRSTMGISVRYSGSDSNGIERVASNACIMVERFYSTNDPTIKITYWDTSPVKPPWRQEFDYWVWRVNYEIRR